MSDLATNATSAADAVAPFPEYVGYIGAMLTCVMFGSYFVPVKKYDAGDGVFFQWVQCCSAMFYGVIYNIVIGSPQFEPLAMVGGVLGATGNFVCTVIIRCIGLGVGMNLMAVVSMTIGWADGRFGWFAPAAIPRIKWLQYLGIALSIVRGGLAALIKLAPKDSSAEANASEITSDKTPRPSVYVDNGGLTLIEMVSKVDRKSSTSSADYKDGSSIVNGDVSDQKTLDEVTTNGESDLRNADEEDFVQRLSPLQRRMLGISLALFAGSTFGFQFATVSVLKEEGGHSQSDFDYAFSYVAGSFVTSTVYTAIYAVAKRNKPVVNAQLLGPGFISGVMWALGQTGWFIANTGLSRSVSYPINTAGPTMVSLFWAVFVFGEIRGTKNLSLLIAVVVLTIASVLMVAFSM